MKCKGAVWGLKETRQIFKLESTGYEIFMFPNSFLMYFLYILAISEVTQCLLVKLWGNNLTSLNFYSS